MAEKLMTSVLVSLVLLGLSCITSDAASYSDDGIIFSNECSNDKDVDTITSPSEAYVSNDIGIQIDRDIEPIQPLFPTICNAYDDASYRLCGLVHQVSLTWHDLTGGVVSILEDPSLTTNTSATGEFEFTGIKACTVLTLVFEHPDMHPVQSGTLFVGNEDLENVTLQTPDHGIYDIFVGAAQTDPDPSLCQIATTVTRAENAGKGPCHACGEPGATVEIWPPVTSSPIYFQLDPTGIIYPQPELTATTEDGGVLFANVPPGDYVLLAHKEGFYFTPARVSCRPGWFVNASPPYGIQGF